MCILYSIVWQEERSKKKRLHSTLKVSADSCFLGDQGDDWNERPVWSYHIAGIESPNVSISATFLSLPQSLFEANGTLR